MELTRVTIRIHNHNWVLLGNVRECYRKITGLMSFTANFNSKHVILQFITKFCWGVGGLQALYKPYMLIKQHIKFLTAARKIANFLS